MNAHIQEKVKMHKLIRFIVLKIETNTHCKHPWICVDVLNDKVTYYKTKQECYHYIQMVKQFYEGLIDITEIE